MRDLTFSVYKNAYGKKTDLQTKSWNEWITTLSAHIILPSRDDEDELNETKKQAPALLLGIVNGNRSKKNVTQLDALALDIDDKTEEEINKSLEPLAPYEWFAYSTHKHNAFCANGHPRMRLVLPLRESIGAKDFFAVWDGLNALTHKVSDQSIRDVARLHFFPSTWSSSVETKTYHNKGEWISSDFLVKNIPETILTPIDTEDLKDVLRKVRKSHPLKELAVSLLSGESLGPPGTRHKAILDLTWYLAKRRPKASKSSVEALFEDSMRTSRIPERLPEVWIAFEGALQKIKEDWGHGKNLYTQEELEHIARVQDCTVEELVQRWVIQKDGGGWILGETGNYRGPYQAKDFQAAIKIDLERAPIDLVTLTQNGVKKKDLADIVCDNGAVAINVQADYTVNVSKYYPFSRTFVEAVLPIRTEFRPIYNPEIHRWLELFGGYRKDKLHDWLSVLPNLGKSLCALYFDGVKGSGKTLLVQGFSRLWSPGGATKLAQVFSNFNSALTNCPVIFADEYIPKAKKNEPITEMLRELIGSSSRELTRKFHSDSTINGQIRLVLAANNEFLLQDAHLVSQEDRAAVAQRFLYHKIGKDAAEYLETIPREQKRQWLEHGIAEHVLWLSENHTIKTPGKRFEVDGDESEIHRMLLTSGYWNRIVCEWLVRYLDNPLIYDNAGQGYARIENGELLCNVQALTDSLTVYLQHTRVTPDTPRMGEALRALAKSKDRVQLRQNHGRVRYFAIDVEPLLDWSERYGVGNRDTMLAHLRGENVQLNLSEEEKLKQRYEDYDA
jgi:hypothetical protein